MNISEAFHKGREQNRCVARCAWGGSLWVSPTGNFPIRNRDTGSWQPITEDITANDWYLKSVSTEHPVYQSFAGGCG